VGSNPTLSAIFFLLSPTANCQKAYDLPQVQRAARRQARPRRAEIPTTSRMSRARLAARANHPDPHALPQRPSELVTVLSARSPALQ
jgi:hypothetical protein